MQLLPPTSAAARDEGPRLIPLPLNEPVSEPSRMEHYLDLADTALDKRKERKGPRGPSANGDA